MAEQDLHTGHNGLIKNMQGDPKYQRTHLTTRRKPFEDNAVVPADRSFKHNAMQIKLVTLLQLQGHPRKYQTYLATRPKSFEANAVALLIDVLRNSKDQPMKAGFWLHIVHLANADLLQDIKQAQDEGMPLLLLLLQQRHHSRTYILLITGTTPCVYRCLRLRICRCAFISLFLWWCVLVCGCVCFHMCVVPNPLCMHA